MKILDLAFEDNLNPKKVASTNGGEYHSPCPGCGGTDRFIIWPIPNRYYCRRCEKTGDVIQYLRDFHHLSFKEACLEANITINSNTKTYVRKSNSFNPIQTNPPELQWQSKGYNFIKKCHQYLLNNPEALLLLEKRGISLKTIVQFQLGFNSESTYEDWQLDSFDRKIWLPKGIVIPSFLKDQLYKIKIRRDDWHFNDVLPKYVEIHGSCPAPASYGNNYSLPIIILESELDAILVQQEASDLCLSLALGGATKKPDNYIHSLLVKASIVIFSLDFDEAGIKAYKWWKNNYKNTFIWVAPFEKSIGEAYLKGLNIQEWLSAGIKQYFKLNN
jgi:DNA primase